MNIAFPSGQVVDIVFDDNTHSYAVAHQLSQGGFSDYRPTHGITAPLSVVPKEFLKPWASKVATEALMSTFRNNPGIIDNIEQFFIDKELMETNARTPDNRPAMSSYKFKKLYPWFGEAKAAYKHKSEIGKDLGTWLHSGIEDYYNSNREMLPLISPDTQGMWDSFMMFDNYYRPKADGLEFFVYSLLFGYSGQGDFRGYINGKYCIGDWKSTNRSDFNPEGIDVDYFFQLGGLAQAEFERTGRWPDDLFIANFDKKGEEPKVVFASEFGMSPQDCARAYIGCFNTYHTIKTWEYKFNKR